MKTYEEVMEILEAYDLTGNYRGAADLVGCTHCPSGRSRPRSGKPARFAGTPPSRWTGCAIQ
ncbi:hypothetical protein, partial [Frankia sp. Cr1]|uniref:hypothetical protein n=1 Tax=Frankia sp. Cr1 TaxID=3073931 RepID=UPI002AD1FD18